MATYVGIDIGATQVRVAVLKGGARRFTVERLLAVDRPRPGASEVFGPDGAALPIQSLEDVLTEAAREAAAGGDPLSVGFAGASTYLRVIELPQAVRRRLAEVLPFELEAQLPVDLDDTVYDFRARPGVNSQKPQPVLVVAARTDDVRHRIDLVKNALGREPDHVAPGGFPLADLATLLPTFRTPGLRAVLDLGFEESEIVILEDAEPVFARTLSRGVAGMPHTAPNLAREIRQTFAGYRATGGTPPESVYICGGGALVHDLARWLSAELQLPVEILPLDGIEGLAGRPDAHRWARVIGIALAASPRRRGIDLRKGDLAFERGYGFLREKIPLLAGLGAALLVTFLFAMWSRSRNLGADRKVLEEVLAQQTKDVFGEATSDPDRVDELLTLKGPLGGDDDPLPRADVMDVMVQMSELIPSGEKQKHDVEKLELSKLSGGGFKVILQGIAPSGGDVETVISQMKTYRCFNNAAITKKTKAISDDRQKYTLEAELRCPEEGGGAKPKSASGAASGGGK